MRQEQVLLLKTKCLEELTAHLLLRNAAGTQCPVLSSWDATRGEDGLSVSHQHPEAVRGCPHSL